MEAHRIAVISDTHGLLRPECIKVLETCEVILHAGDVGSFEILSELKNIAESYVVRGNVDQGWAGELPFKWEKELYGFRFYMVHNKRDIGESASGADIVICGHSHKYEEKKQGKTVFLNPGSCGPRRFRLSVTMAVLTLYPERHHLKIEKIDCMPESGQEAVPDGFPRKDMDKLIGKIVKEMKAGRGVAEIAAKVHGEEALVEQVCRIYATHPGVDVDGILNRIEIKDR